MCSSDLVETGYPVPTIFNSVVIGNSKNLDDTYSGYVSDFTLNYVNQPLQIGIYKLDLNVSHTEYIKPKQDGVAVFSVYAGSGTKINYVNYKSFGAAEVRLFTSSNTVEEYYSCSNGTALYDSSSLTHSELAEDTVYLVSARVHDEISSSSYYDVDLPKITNFSYKGYSTNEVNAINSPAKITSLADNPFGKEDRKSTRLNSSH